MFINEIEDDEEIDNLSQENDTKRKNNVIITANVKKAKRVLKLIDSVFDIYIQNKLKELEIIPMISSKKMKLDDVDDSYFDTIQKQRIKRKIIILQKVYIEGNPKELLGEEYIDTKTFVNDKTSLIEDLSILLFGVDGLNYKLLEKNGIII